MTKLCLSCAVEVKSISKAARSRQEELTGVAGSQPEAQPQHVASRSARREHYVCHMHNSMSCLALPKGPCSVNYFSYYLCCDSCESLLQTWFLIAAKVWGKPSQSTTRLPEPPVPHLGCAGCLFQCNNSPQKGRAILHLLLFSFP